MCVILRPFSPKKHQTTAFEIGAIALHCKPQTDGWHCAIGQTFLEQFFPACSFLHLICDNSVKALFAPKVTDPALAAILQRRRLLSEPQVEVTGAAPAAPAYLIPFAVPLWEASWSNSNDRSLRDGAWASGCECSSACPKLQNRCNIYIYSAGFMIKIGQKLHECQRVSAGPVAHHIYDGSQILRQSLSAIFACTVKHGRLAATVRFRSSSANFLK